MGPIFVRLPIRLYPLLRAGLFRLDPERAHAWAARALAALQRHPSALTALAARLSYTSPRLAVRAWDLEFAHPVGLAAGFDKDAAFPRAAWALGFAFAELGTVTPRPQPGNPRPRLFRLPRHEALVNRMGFNNAGLEAFVANLARARPSPIPLGANIGRNAATPPERAVDDYLACFAAVAPLADFVVVNVSSPNTPGLRDLQAPGEARRLLSALDAARRAHAAAGGRRVPLLVKVAPDLDDAQLQALAEACLEAGADGFVATNTTLTRPGLDPREAALPGGLSGRPLRPLATRVTARLYLATGGRVPIVGVGGILDPEDAYERIRAGATLLEVYTALVYRGPGVVRHLLEGLDRLLARDGVRRLQDAVGADARRLAGSG